MDKQKILIIFGAAWVSAALLTWIFIAKTHCPKIAATRKIVAAARDLPIGTRIRKIDIKQIEALEKDLPKGALFQDKDALDRALLFPVSANEALTNFKQISRTRAGCLHACNLQRPVNGRVAPFVRVPGRF